MTERQRGGQEGRLPAGRYGDLAGKLLRLLPERTGDGSVQALGSEHRTGAVCASHVGPQGLLALGESH